MSEEPQALQRIESAPPAPMFGGVNIEALLEKAVDAKSAVEVLERLANMRREMRAEAAKEAFDSAMAAFQAECPIIRKDASVSDKNGRTRYRYAPLDSIVAQVKELLQAHGFSYRVTAKVDQENLTRGDHQVQAGWVTAVCTVIHAAGHSEPSEFKVPIDPEAYMNQAQKFASAMTFAKRYCLHPSTLTLDGNLDWKPLSEISIGDQLIAFDEFTEHAKRRRYRITTVTSIKVVKLPSRIITLEDGRTIISSNDHLWLSGRPRGTRVLATTCDICGRKFESARSRGLHRRMAHGITKEGNGWVKTQNIGAGSILRDFGTPWKRDFDYDAGYLAGVFDGEACLTPKGPGGTRGFALQFSQKPGSVMDKTYALLKAKNFLIRYGSHKNGVHALHVCGGYDSIRFLGQIRPVRLYAKAKTWIDGAGCRNKIGPGPIRVISCDEIGTQELISIETTAGTLFANGLYSHNCFCNAFGILTGDQDDDAGASDPEHAAGQGKRTEYRRTPPPPPPPPQQAPPPATRADKAKSFPDRYPTEATRTWAIKELTGGENAKRERVTEFLIKAGCLLPTETIDNWKFCYVPSSNEQLKLVITALADFENGLDAKIPFYHVPTVANDPTLKEKPKAKPKTVEVPRDPDAGDQSTAPTTIDPNWEKVSGKVDFVKVKSGTSGRGPWTSYGVKMGEQWYNSFSKRLGGLAETAQKDGFEIDLYYSADDRGGKKIEHIEA